MACSTSFCATMLSNTVDTSSTEIARQPMPSMPSNWAITKVIPGCEVTSPNVCARTATPATRNVSVERNPLTAPLPYWMLNKVPFASYELDCSLLYLLCVPATPYNYVVGSNIRLTGNLRANAMGVKNEIRMLLDKVVTYNRLYL